MNAQFLIDNYEIKNRRDRDKYGGGLINFCQQKFLISLCDTDNEI